MRLKRRFPGTTSHLENNLDVSFRPHNLDMSTYKRHRFPHEIISYEVWLYYCFNLSHRRSAGSAKCRTILRGFISTAGINVIYESLRCWYLKFGSKYAKRLRKKHRGFGDTFFVDEVFVKIGGKQLKFNLGQT